MRIVHSKKTNFKVLCCAVCLALAFLCGSILAQANEVSVQEGGVVREPELTKSKRIEPKFTKLESTELSMGKYSDSERDEGNNFIADPAMYWLDTQRRAWAGDIASLGAYIDGLMGNVDAISDHNQSYVRLYLGVWTSKYDALDELFRVRFSLDLPITKKRLRFILESDAVDEGDIEDQGLQDSLSSESQLDEGVNASFRYLFDSSQWQRLSFDWGVKARIDPDLFSRARAVRSWPLTEKWSLTYSQELFWYESKGAGIQTTFDFDRLVQREFLFRLSSSGVWYERTDGIAYFQQASFYHDINERRAVEYSIGFHSEDNQGHCLISEYFARIRYRRDLYKGWLFYDLSAGADFSRVHDFQTNPFIGMRLEVLFSDDAERAL